MRQYGSPILVKRDVLDSAARPSAAACLAECDQLSETVEHADEGVVESPVLQESCGREVGRGVPAWAAGLVERRRGQKGYAQFIGILRRR